MKTVAWIGLATLFFLLGLGGILAWQRWQNQPAAVSPVPTPLETDVPAFTAQDTTFTLDPPRLSLNGQVTKLAGTVTVDTRTATASSALLLNQLLLEDEKVTTDATGSATLVFPPALTLEVGPDSIVSLASTQPAHFLVKQDRGTVSYQTDDVTTSVAMRSLHALFTVTKGQASLTTDPDTKKLTFTLISGQGQLGYINTDNQTQMVEVKAGQTLFFDDVKRLVTVE
jgi:hypothetical protein